MSTLPTELLRMIFEHLKHDRRSLCALSLSSRTLRTEAQRLLFAGVLDLNDIHKQRAFINAINDAPTRLALLVKEYMYHYPLPSRPPPTNNLHVRAATALRAMVNLKRLEVCMSRGQSVPWILYKCTFRLEHFKWVSHYATDFEALVHWFLPHQDSLKHLETTNLPLGRLKQCSVALTCPNLVSLSGPNELVLTFLPGRKIETLEWTRDIEDRHGACNLEPISKELSCLRSVSYTSDFGMFGSSSGDAINHLSDIEVLKAKHRHIFNLPKPSGLHKLRILVLTDFGIRNVSSLKLETMFSSCGSLEYVDVESGKNVFRRYKRPQSGRPCIGHRVDIAEVRWR